jgi:hypothetical protein
MRYTTAMSIIHMRNGPADLLGLEELCGEVIGLDDAVVEIGCYMGESSRIIARYAGTLYCIDQWSDGLIESSSARNSRFCYSDMARVEAIFDSALADRPNVVKMRGNSNDLVDLFTDRLLDFVYIDALHAYEAVRNDIWRWWPKIAEGGYIGGHNHSPRWPGVVRAVREAFGGPYKLYRDSSWVVQKTSGLNVLVSGLDTSRL